MSHGYQQKQAKKNRSRYLDWIVTATCGPDLLAAKLFPNAKEVTETAACFEASKHTSLFWNDKDVTAFIVGDGHKPRTGATFACRTAWECYSIDPVLAPVSYDFKRLRVFRSKIEDMPALQSLKALIVLPHSHADINVCLEKIQAPIRSVITLDCCFKNIIPNHAPDIEYVDADVWSPHNIVRVWRNV